MQTRTAFSPLSVTSRTDSLEKHTIPTAAPGLAAIPVPISSNSFDDSDDAASCINDSTNEVGTDETTFFLASSVFSDFALATKSISQLSVCSFCIIVTTELNEMIDIQQVP
ncbi:MAG: Uncharacterised protein [Acidimicrobiaceae bacterium]|nr:MAG: Uncharacterised protein [Acidimicrobiaceae bacterium]